MLDDRLRRRGMVLFIIGVCTMLISSCSKSGGGLDGQDEDLDLVSPSVISSLTVTAVAPTAVVLQWIAPGDDRDSGLAAAYDLRYSRQEIDSTTWPSADSVRGMPTPEEPGMLQSIEVTGLQEDSTYYFAIRAVDEAGNWSRLSNIATAMCFDNFAVTIPDTAFERNIRFRVGKPTGDILRSDLFALNRLHADNQHIHDLSGIEYCINLEALLLWNNHVTDLTLLAGLTRLRVLKVGYNGITDISPLSSLVSLDTLHLNANSIGDLTALVPLNGLTELELTANALWNLAPLADKTSIRNLYLDANQIVFVSPLYNLIGLEKLKLAHNQIDDILGLTANPGLNAGDTVWLTDNPLSAASTDSLLTVLRNRGVVVIY